MIVESPEDVAKFLHLQTLTIEELKLQCKSYNLEKDKNSKSFLIEMIMKGGVTKSYSQGLLPQGIPLRSKHKNGKYIQGTGEKYRLWRKIIFNANGNLKEFKFINKEGKSYSDRVWYVQCKLETAKNIINNKWHSPYESQRELIKQIKQNPEQFNFHIVQKNAGNGNNFLMLHCQVKED